MQQSHSRQTASVHLNHHETHVDSCSDSEVVHGSCWSQRDIHRAPSSSVGLMFSFITKTEPLIRDRRNIIREQLRFQRLHLLQRDANQSGSSCAESRSDPRLCTPRGATLKRSHSEVMSRRDGGRTVRAARGSPVSLFPRFLISAFLCDT